MFKARHYVARNLNFPVFLEIVADPGVLTLRSYREIVPKAQETPDAQSLIEYASSTGGMSLLLTAPQFLAEQKTECPVGRHSPVVQGLRTPFFRPRPTDMHVVDGETLGEDLRGRFFVEVGSATLDRTQDATLTPDLWIDGAEWVFDIDINGFPTAPYCKCWLGSDKLPRSSRISMMLGRRSALRVYQPFKNTPFDECSFYFLCERTMGFRTSRPFEWIELATHVHDALHFLPELQWTMPPGSAVAPDGQTHLRVECVDPETRATIAVNDVPVFLESDSGYLPRRRVPLVNGSAEFEIRALGLRAGEKIRLSAAFESASRQISFDLPVQGKDPR